MAEATDLFTSFKTNLESSCEGGFSASISDTVDLPYVTRAIRIGNAGGTLALIMKNGSAIEIPVQAYEFLPLRATRVTTHTTVDVWGFY